MKINHLFTLRKYEEKEPIYETYKRFFNRKNELLY